MQNTELSPILKENIDLSRVIILEASIRNAYNTFPYEMSLQVTGMNLPNTSFTLEANATNLILPMNVHHPPVQLLNKSDLIQNPLLRKYAHLDMKSLKEGTATINGSTFVAKQNDFSKFLLKNSGIFSSVKELDDKVSISNEHFSAAVTVFKDRVLRNIPHSNLTELGVSSFCLVICLTNIFQFVVKRANEKPLDCWENSQFAHLPEAEIDYLSGEVRNLSFTLDIKWAYSFPESLDEIAGHSAQLPINSYPK